MKRRIISMILLAALLLGEPLGGRSLAAILLLGAGTALMLSTGKRGSEDGRGARGWFLFAALSAVFAALTAIFGKLGVQTLDSNVATAIRTIFVLLCAWGMVFLQGQQTGLREIGGKSWVFLILSGLATGLSWLCYYRALQSGNVGVVVPIDKLSIVVTAVLSRVFLKERLTGRNCAGLALLVAGTLLLL